MITIEDSILHDKAVTIIIDNYDANIRISVDLTATEANEIARNIFSITEYKDDTKEDY